jgi:predicted ATPase/DNA-binding CsgD family transcriptional regulator
MALRTNLPAVLTSFIGRGREITEIRQLLATSRFVTLTGAAGCGKSRLALRVAAEAARHFSEGAHWIELAPLAEGALVPQSVAKVLHLDEGPVRSSLQWLVDALGDRQLLLVLDNCEHLLGTCRHLVETLLAASAVTILATSREPLGVVGERVFPVEPLTLPPRFAGDLATIAQYDAVQLFVARAQAILPTFKLTAGNVDAVAAVCRQLDGIPLAIELATARLNVLSIEQIAARLDDALALLPPAPRLAHSHHRSLRAAIEWSWALLGQPEKTLLRRLSVFKGGCSLVTVERVCAGNGVKREEVLEILASLADKSLLTAETLRRVEARYALLETIRQYAQEKLVAAGERPSACRRHLDCFLELAEETEAKLVGPYQEMWLNWLEVEYGNIRAALGWSLEDNQVEAGLRIAVALYQFWTIRDYVEEGATWLGRLLARADERIPAVLRANGLAYAAFLAGFRGDNVAQDAYGREAALLAEAAGADGKSALAWALAAKAYGARAVGDYQTEFTLGKQAIQLRRELGDRYYLGLSLSIYSYTAMSVGAYEAARAMLDEGLPLLRESGNPYRIAMALNFSGDLARCEGDYHQAHTAYEESATLLRELSAVRDLASVLHNLGHTYLHFGRVEDAGKFFQEGLTLHQGQQNRPGVAECLIGFAGLALAQGQPAAGARLLAAATAIGGERVASAWPATRLAYEHYVARAQTELSAREFRAEQKKGRTLTLERAVLYAQAALLKAATAQTVRQKLEELTAREREVAALIAQGKSNTDIAAILVISKRTVESHVGKILAKLEATNRAQIVRWGIEAGLLGGEAENGRE